MTPKVSIIIPAYNVGKYLHKCLQSVYDSTYDNYEVIIIVDGATDDSMNIAEAFCKNHENFFVFWQKNMGSGPARNNGLERASGELIMFIDPDDWIEPNYIENMVTIQQRENFDLVTASSRTFYFDNRGHEKKVKKNIVKGRKIMGQNAVRNSYLDLLNENRLGGPHRKVFKASIIKDKNIRFPDLRRSQDIVFNYRYYNYVQSVCVAEEYGYNYRVELSSGQRKVAEDYYRTLVFIYEDIKKLLSNWNTSCNIQYLSFFLMNLLFSYLKKMVATRKSIKETVDNPVVQEISRNAKNHPKKHIALCASMIVSRKMVAMKCFLWLMKKMEILKTIRK